MKQLISQAFRTSAKAAHAAITLAGELDSSRYPTYRRVQMHHIVKLFANGGYLGTFGPMPRSESGIETTLVNGEPWGWRSWGGDEIYDSSVEYFDFHSDYNGTYVCVPFRVDGVWYVHRLSTTGRHDYVAILFRDGDQMRQLPLATRFNDMPKQIRDAFYAAKKLWHDADYEDAERPETPVLATLPERKTAEGTARMFMNPSGRVERMTRLVHIFLRHKREQEERRYEEEILPNYFTDVAAILAKYEADLDE